MRSITVTLEVPFHDVDLMEVVWHGHYLKYFEIARCALLESIGYNYLEMRASGFAWPVVETQLRYVRPARFGQKLAVSAELVEWENRLRMRYQVRDAATGERLTSGASTQVAVDLATREMCFVCPPILFEKLGVPRP